MVNDNEPSIPIDELIERIAAFKGRDIGMLMTGVLSNGQRYTIMPLGHYQQELNGQYERGKASASKPVVNDTLADELERLANDNHLEFDDDERAILGRAIETLRNPAPPASVGER